MKKILFTLAPVLLLSSFLMREKSISEVLEKINQYFNERPMEKIFLHMDKPYYTSGDDLWYSAYVVNYNSNTASKLSEILHVEIFDKEGNSVVHQKHPIENGLAHGLIKIPTLTPDYYLIKAYTNWSKNFGEGLNYNRYIKVVSSKYSSRDNPKETSVQFYPEGGAILTNRLNQVLFKSNLNQPTTAYLLDSERDTLAKIAYNGKGFGKFRIVPKSSGDTYHLAIDGSSKQFKLPKANENGVALRLNETESYYDVSLHSSDNLYGSTYSFILLNNGNIVSAQEGVFKNFGNLLRLPKESMLEGLHHLLIIDENLKVLTQRLFYNTSRSADSIQIRGKKTINLGDDVQLQLFQNNNSKSHLSVAVTPYKYFGASELSSIKYNFNFSDISTDEININDRMISMDMNTYDVSDILAGSSPDFRYPIEKQDLFAINISLDQSNESENDIHSVSIKRKDSIDFYFAEEKNNRLTFVIPAFNGRRDLIIKPHEWSGKQPKYTLQNSYPAKAFEMDFDQTMQETAYARYSRENKAIHRFYNSPYKKRTDNYEAQLTLSILRSFDRTINLKEYIVLPDMSTVVKELLEGVRIRKNVDGQDVIRMFGIDRQTGYYKKLHDGQPLMVIDGLPVYDSKRILDLDPLEVKTINLSYAKGVLNNVSYEGILSVETVEGNYGKIAMLGQEVFDFHGYADNYEFVLPNSQPNHPDFRPTYYWNPHVELIGNQSITITFPTSHEPGKYLVDVQGINEEGTLMTSQFTFEVR